MEWILTSPFSPLMWNNVIFAGMMFIAMAYFLFTILGGLFEGDVSEGQVEHMDQYDAGLDGGSEHHFLHHDGDVQDADDGDTDHGNDVGSEGSLDLFNTQKRCPFVFALTTFLLLWGMAGYMMNIFDLCILPASFGAILGFVSTLILTGFVSLMIVRQIAPIIAKTLPYGHGSINRYDLIGQLANPSTILEPGKIGYIEIPMSNGSVINKLAELHSSGGLLRRSDSVYVSEYDHERDLYIVVPTVPLN